MQVIVYQMRRNGVEIARELLGDEARNIGELRVGVFEDGDRRRPTKAARLQRDSGEVIMELVDGHGRNDFPSALLAIDRHDLRQMASAVAAHVIAALVDAGNTDHAGSAGERI